MKLSKEYTYKVLCEDAQTRTFLYSFLSHQGINSHKIRIDMSPAGKLCGSQYVEQQYRKNVIEYFGKRFQNIVLLVCTDADNLSVEKRVEFVENKAIDVECDRKKETIIIWAPRRQIENWIHFWREGASEEDEFRHTGKPERCSKEAEMMSEYLSGQMEKELTLPSIEHAKQEYERVCSLQADRGLRF